MLINKKILETELTTKKVQMLERSVSEVSKHELLPTNQYIKQMKLVLEIFIDMTNRVN
jgi:hypothetical protein